MPQTLFPTFYYNECHWSRQLWFWDRPGDEPSSYWILWNIHPIILPIICWSCVPHTLTPTTWCFSFLLLLCQFFMVSFASYLKHPSHFNTYGIWSMRLQQPVYIHLPRKKIKFRKVKWIVQTYPSRKWQNQDWSHLSWFPFYTTAFLCTWGLNQALQSSLIPLKLWKWLKYPEVADPPHTPGGIKSKTNNINKIRYLFVCMLSCFSRIWLFATLWTVAGQIPVSMGFFKQGYRIRLPFPSPGDLPNPGIDSTSLVSPALAGRFFTTNTSFV